MASRHYGLAVPQPEDFQTQLAMASEDLERLAARLARFSPLAWRTRRAAIQALLAALVTICERQQGRSLPTPDLDTHVLADAVAVIGREIVESLGDAPDRALLDALRSAIDAALAGTR
jgi:hypothetical protein